MDALDKHGGPDPVSKPTMPPVSHQVVVLGEAGSENAPPGLVLPGGFSFDHSKTEDSERQLRSLAGLAHLQLAANVFESLSIRYVPGDKPFRHGQRQSLQYRRASKLARRDSFRRATDRGIQEGTCCVLRYSLWPAEDGCILRNGDVGLLLLSLRS
jgi:hypothetical protein